MPVIDFPTFLFGWQIQKECCANITILGKESSSEMETESLQHHRQSAQHVHRPDLCYTLQNCLSLDVIQPAVAVRVSNKRDSLLLFLVFCFF